MEVLDLLRIEARSIPEFDEVSATHQPFRAALSGVDEYTAKGLDVACSKAGTTSMKQPPHSAGGEPHAVGGL
jgi:hypothetical protein